MIAKHKQAAPLKEEINQIRIKYQQKFSFLRVLIILF